MTNVVHRPLFHCSLFLCCHSSIVVCHVANGNVAPASCVRKGEGEESHCSPGGLPSSLSFLHHCWLPCCLLLVIKKQWGRGECLTWINVNDDDDLCCHRLEMACPLMCHVIFDPCC